MNQAALGFLNAVICRVKITYNDAFKIFSENIFYGIEMSQNFTALDLLSFSYA